MRGVRLPLHCNRSWRECTVGKNVQSLEALRMDGPFNQSVPCSPGIMGLAVVCSCLCRHPACPDSELPQALCRTANHMSCIGGSEDHCARTGYHSTVLYHMIAWMFPLPSCLYAFAHGHLYTRLSISCPPAPVLELCRVGAPPPLFHVTDSGRLVSWCLAGEGCHVEGYRRVSLRGRAPRETRVGWGERGRGGITRERGRG